MNDISSLFNLNRNKFLIIDPISKREILQDGAFDYEQFYLDIIFQKLDVDSDNALLFLEHVLANPIITEKSIRRIFNWIEAGKISQTAYPVRKAIDEYINKLARIALENPNISENFVFDCFDDFTEEMLSCQAAESFILSNDDYICQAEKCINEGKSINPKFSEKMYKKLSRFCTLNVANPNLSEKFIRNNMFPLSNDKRAERFFKQVANNDILIDTINNLKPENPIFYTIEHVFQNNFANSNTIRLAMGKLNRRHLFFTKGINFQMDDSLFVEQWNLEKLEIGLETYRIYLISQINKYNEISKEIRELIISFFDSLGNKKKDTKTKNAIANMIAIMTEDEILDRIGYIVEAGFEFPVKTLIFNETVVLKGYLNCEIQRFSKIKSERKELSKREICLELRINRQYFTDYESDINIIENRHVSVKFLRRNMGLIRDFGTLACNRQILEEYIAKYNFNLMNKIRIGEIDLVKFYHRPGNSGYERAKNNFEKLR